MSLASWWFNKEDDVIVVSISWSKGIDTSTQISGTGTLSPKFVSSPNKDIMDVDSGDHIFSTNYDMMVSISIKSTGGGNADFEVGYGPNVDSITGWTKLWSGNVATTAISNPRSMFMPKGNYIIVHRTGGTQNLLFSGSCSASHEVAAESDRNDDMEGNSP